MIFLAFPPESRRTLRTYASLVIPAKNEVQWPIRCDSTTAFARDPAWSMPAGILLAECLYR